MNTLESYALSFVIDEYLRELCPLLCACMKIKKLVQSCVEPISRPSTPSCIASSITNAHSTCSSSLSSDNLIVSSTL